MGHWFAPERYETPDFVLRSYDAGDGPLVAAATRESYEHLRPMWVRASEAGRGLGTRLLGAMLSWGFSEWPWLRLAWRCDDRNRASMRVAEKCGLRLEGLLRGQAAEVGGGRRDTATFAITRDEWLARQPPSKVG